MSDPASDIEEATTTDDVRKRLKIDLCEIGEIVLDIYLNNNSKATDHERGDTTPSSETSEAE